MSKNDEIRLLIVDDHFLMRAGLAATVNAESDMRVVAEAKDGEQAIEEFRRHRPDVTLMDLRMPGMSGIEAITAIRSEFANSRIIVLSTYDGDEDIHRAIEAGAQTYLLKNTLHDELLQAIRAVHSGQRHLPRTVAEKLAQRVYHSDLSQREAEVLRLIALGLSNKEIAVRLGISEATIKFHVINILTKLGVDDRTLAVVTAIRRGIIYLP